MEPLPRTVMGGKKVDTFCWICHFPGQDEICKKCPRVFHRACLKGALRLKGGVCNECLTESIDGTSFPKWVTAKKLKSVYRLAVERVKLHYMKNSKDLNHICFRWPESPENEKLFEVMDIEILNDFIDHHTLFMKSLKSGEIFAKIKWLVHNCAIIYGYVSEQMREAKAVVKEFRKELQDIEACVDCYQRKHSSQVDEDFFIQLCKVPHDIVWAQMKSWPYWPAKCLKVINQEAYVRFFGKHETALVPVSKVYFYSEEYPKSKAPKKKDYQDSIAELKRYICEYDETMPSFRRFKYAKKLLLYSSGENPNPLPNYEQVPPERPNIEVIEVNEDSEDSASLHNNDTLHDTGPETYIARSEETHVMHVDLDEETENSYDTGGESSTSSEASFITERVARETPQIRIVSPMSLAHHNTNAARIEESSTNQNVQQEDFQPLVNYASRTLFEELHNQVSITDVTEEDDDIEVVNVFPVAESDQNIRLRISNGIRNIYWKVLKAKIEEIMRRQNQVNSVANGWKSQFWNISTKSSNLFYRLMQEKNKQKEMQENSQMIISGWRKEQIQAQRRLKVQEAEQRKAVSKRLQKVTQKQDFAKNAAAVSENNQVSKRLQRRRPIQDTQVADSNDPKVRKKRKNHHPEETHSKNTEPKEGNITKDNNLAGKLIARPSHPQRNGAKTRIPAGAVEKAVSQVSSFRFRPAAPVAPESAQLALERRFLERRLKEAREYEISETVQAVLQGLLIKAHLNTMMRHPQRAEERARALPNTW